MDSKSSDEEQNADGQSVARPGVDGLERGGNGP
jgi:hypothetical protein